MNLTLRFAHLSLAGLLVSLAACGSDASDGTGVTGGDKGSTTTSSLIDARCAAQHGCCVAGGKPSSKEACVATYNQRVGNAKLGADADACEAYLRTHASDGVVCAVDLDGPDHICRNAFDLGNEAATLRRALGETCDTDDDCAAPPTAGARASCRPSSYSGSGNATVCIELVPAQANAPCAYTETAIGSQYSLFGSSSKPEDAKSFSFGLCKYEDGLYCNSMSKTCVALGNVDDPCTGDAGCVKGATCQYEKGTANQLCFPRAAVGETCTVAFGGSCVDGATCKGQVCTTLLNDGQACDINSDCASLLCKNDKCEGNSVGGRECFTAN